MAKQLRYDGPPDQAVEGIALQPGETYEFPDDVAEELAEHFWFTAEGWEPAEPHPLPRSHAALDSLAAANDVQFPADATVKEKQALLTEAGVEPQKEGSP